MKRYILYAIGYVVVTIIYEIIVISSTSYTLPHNAFGFILCWSLVLFPVGLGYYLGKKFNLKREKENNIFIKDWTLIDFAKEFGPRMQVGEFYTISGKSYHKCVFTRPDGKQTYVGFFSQLGELTNQEISDRKNELKVGLTASQKYYLHDSNVEMWEDVKL